MKDKVQGFLALGVVFEGSYTKGHSISGSMSGSDSLLFGKTTVCVRAQAR